MKNKNIIVYIFLLILNIIIFTFIFAHKINIFQNQVIKPDFTTETIFTDSDINTNTNSSVATIGTNKTESMQNDNIAQIPATVVINAKYTSTGLNLSLQMPATFHLAGGLDLSSDFFQAMTFNDMAPYDLNTKGIKLEIISLANNKKLPLLEWVNQSDYYYDQKIPDFTDIKIADNPAIEQEAFIKALASRTCLISKNKKVYIVEFSGDRESYDKYLKDIELIIKSISFL
ncbi:MAG: hypothetical protein V1898_04705 [Patescibacteria group bacterium]